jgi:hypothetical protein
VVRPLSSLQLSCGEWNSNEILQTPPKSCSRKRDGAQCCSRSDLRELRFWTVRSVSNLSEIATCRPRVCSLPIDTLYVDQYYSYRRSIGEMS